MTDSGTLRLLVGTYTASSGGHGPGIVLVEPREDAPADSAGLAGRTVAVLDDPSFIAVTGDRLYAVSETAEGSVHAFRRDGAALEYLWDAPSGGDAPCHVRVDRGSALVVTNYVSGTATAVGLDAAERHAASIRTKEAALGEHGGEQQTVTPDSARVVVALPDVTGPVTERQEGPHAHQSAQSPDGTVLITDLGGDAIHEFRIAIRQDGTPTFERVRVHEVAPGSGPRHMAWFGGDLIVVGELDGIVRRLRPDADGTLRERANAAVSNGTDRAVQPSHLEVDAAGHVYVAVRGQDTIAVLDASGDGLAFVTAVPCGGEWPRHFALVDGSIVVANQYSDTLTVLPLDAAGVPGAVTARVPVGSPACVVPIG